MIFSGDQECGLLFLTKVIYKQLNLNPLFELIFCSVMILRLTTQVLITTVT